METMAQDVMDCSKLGQSVLITGDSGSGLTQICRYIESIFAQKEVRVHRYLVCRENDPLKALRDLCYSIEPAAIKADWRLHSMAFTIRTLSRIVKSRDIAMIILDRADLASDQFIEAVFQGLEVARESGHQCGVVLTASLRIAEFTRVVAGVSSPMYRHHHVPRLATGDMLAVLSNWCAGFDDLLAKLGAGDEEARQLCEYLQGKLGGSFRSLTKFAKCKNFRFPAKAITRDLIDTIMAELTPQFSLGS